MLHSAQELGSESNHWRPRCVHRRNGTKQLTVGAGVALTAGAGPMSSTTRAVLRSQEELVRRTPRLALVLRTLRQPVRSSSNHHKSTGVRSITGAGAANGAQN